MELDEIEVELIEIDELELEENDDELLEFELRLEDWVEMVEELEVLVFAIAIRQPFFFIGTGNPTSILIGLGTTLPRESFGLGMSVLGFWGLGPV